MADDPLPRPSTLDRTASARRRVRTMSLGRWGGGGGAGNGVLDRGASFAAAPSAGPRASGGADAEYGRRPPPALNAYAAAHAAAIGKGDVSGRPSCGDGR